MHAQGQGVEGARAEADKQAQRKAAAKKAKKDRQKTTKRDSQQAQQAQQTTEQKILLQQAEERAQIAQDEAQQAQQAQQPLQQAQQPSLLNPHLHPDLDNNINGRSLPKTPLSGPSGMHNNQQQPSQEGFGNSINAAQCLLPPADCTLATAQLYQLAAEEPDPSPSAVTAVERPAAHAHTEADHTLATVLSIPDADVQPVSWAASSPQLMCCPLTQVSPTPAPALLVQHKSCYTTCTCCMDIFMKI